jgi:hypothetical protein
MFSGMNYICTSGTVCVSHIHILFLLRDGVYYCFPPMEWCSMYVCMCVFLTSVEIQIIVLYLQLIILIIHNLILSFQVNHVHDVLMFRMEPCSQPPTINIGTLLDVLKYVLFVMVRELSTICDVSGYTCESNILFL